MRIRLLFVFLVCSINAFSAKINANPKLLLDKMGIFATNAVLFAGQEHYTRERLVEIKNQLHLVAPTLNPVIIDKIIATLECSQNLNIASRPILTVIDYSLPANEKRLWVFNISKSRLLFHTYVSHGIKSGSLNTDAFSNKYDSKASSIGVFQTDDAYRGREGMSLRLAGLDKGFNDNASNRYIVMHGGWYMSETFIKKYGRPGRSWGCPALPLDEIQPVIEAIKNKSLLIVYYPNSEWFYKSKFLNCTNSYADAALVAPPLPSTAENRESILFADINKNNRRDEYEPVLAISADNYQKLFNQSAPVGRMLRRQINSAEYVALSAAEFNRLVEKPQLDQPAMSSNLDAIQLITAEVKSDRGYYKTEMKIMPYGKIQHVTPLSSALLKDGSLEYSAVFEKKNQFVLKPTALFIRWVGL